MHVVTFYSFKGGVGRTMALINAAMELTERGRRVLVVDFDLEAPGVPTYKPFLNAGKGRGIVEYVTNYISSGEAPDAKEYIHENTLNGKSIWLMPAGFPDATYGHRLNSIDWLKLYKDHNGYLMFEDLRQQWESILHFDYVLIDSRTGHTDVGGICTRQLPDSTVLMFLPNDQNITGLEEVVRNIRAEESSLRKKAIHCHFCPSNVPDLDDEELILQRHLEESKERLGYIEPASIIHHYNSLALLDQMIFIKERPRSRLAEEYRKLVEAIIAENIEDKSGALSKLSKFRDTLRHIQPSQGSQIEQFLDAIVKHHPDDGEIAWLASQLYFSLGNLDSELAQLNVAIRHHVNEVRARSRRAVLLERDVDAATVRDDLRFVVSSPEAGVSEIASSLRRLRSVDNDWLEVVSTSSVISNLQGSEKTRITEALMLDRGGSGLAAKLLLAGSKGEETSRMQRVNLALALIGNGQYQKALEILGDKAKILRTQSIEDAFNFACAQWAVTGTPPLDVFAQVHDLAQRDSDRNDPNFFQCLAMTNYVLGKTVVAQNMLTKAKFSIAAREREAVFSCWRYLLVNKNEFVADLQEMEGQFGAQEKLLPSYLRQPALSVQ